MMPLSAALHLYCADHSSKDLTAITSTTSHDPGKEPLPHFTEKKLRHREVTAQAQIWGW